MTSSHLAPSSPPPEKRLSFWQRRVTDPIWAQLKQGVSSDEIARTLAVGTWLSLFPFFGFTTLLNLAVGYLLKMNQPILQTLNYLLGPVHLVMVVVYVRLGEMIWRAEPIPFSVTALLETFHRATFAEFLHQFGWAGVHAFTAWMLSLPLLVPGLQFALRPLIRRLAQLRTGRAVTP